MASSEKTDTDAAGMGKIIPSGQQQSPPCDPSINPTEPSSEAVEMTQLTTQPMHGNTAATEPANPTQTLSTTTTTHSDIPAHPSSSEPSAPTAMPAQLETVESALGPEGAALPAHASDSSEAVLRITLMLTTGSRHPYLITSKYLAARKVDAVDAQGTFDPREMSAYKLKELIWTDWRSEWEPRPRDPAAIRLIILGRMLDDKSQLKESPFSLVEPNVVHMTVKPADLLDDEAEGTSKGMSKSLRGRSVDDGESAGCCKCVIQ